MTPFLKSVADYIYQNYKENLHEVSIVFPNKRARVFFNQYLAKLTDKPIFTPQYYTISEYMQQLSGKPLADQLSQLFLLYDVYVSVTNSKESFDDFLFYCEMLQADFDDIDKYLVNAKLLYQNLSDLKDIEAYYQYLDESQVKAIQQFWKTFSESKESEEKEKFGNLWNILFKIYTEFNSELDKQGLSYEGSAYRYAIESLKENSISSDNTVAFIGFNALNNCEKELFRHLKNQNKALFFWDYDTYYTDKEKSYHEAAFFMRDLLKDFPSPKNFTFESKLSNKNRTIKVVDIATNTGQAKALTNIFKELPTEWQNNPINTAVALADESLLMPVLNAFPQEVKEVNISMGYPLKETQVYGLTALLLDLHKNKKQESFYHADVTSILQYGLLPGKDNEHLIELTENITNHNLVYINAKDFEKLPAIYSLIFKENVIPKDYVSYLIDIINYIPEYLTTESENIKIVETEASFRIVSQLTRISDILKKSSVEFSFNSLTRLLSKILQGATVPFIGEPVAGVQVMGILETRNIDFENLIILSMNEGVFPKSGNVPSFVPYTLRKAFDMPTIEHQDAIFAYYFYRLLQRSKNVTLVYTSSVNDTISGEPSRFIHQLMYEEAFKLKQETISYKVNPVNSRTINIERNKETQKILLEKYTTKNSYPLSPSAINTYLSCKTRFYYRYIANLKEPDSILEEVEANTLGSILHKCIEELYKPYDKQVLSAEIIKQLIKSKDLINNTIIKAYWEEYLSPAGKEFPGTEHVKLHGKNAIIKEVILKYVIAVLEHDLKIAPIQLLGLEDNYKTNFQTKNGYLISTGGIIDRIDEVNKQLRIIDYKTGKVKDSFNSIEDLFFEKPSKRNSAAFQTLLYSLVLSKNKESEIDIQPGLYYVRNIRNKNYSSKIRMGKGAKAFALDSISEIKDEFEELLISTLSEIFSDTGKFEQTEDEDYCQYCPYIKICGR